MSATRTMDIIILTAVTLTAIFFYGQIDYRSEPFSGMDLKYYREMAAASPSVAESIPRPFAFRILGPWLAGLAGDGTAGFRALTIILSVSLVLAFYRLLLCTGTGRRAAVVSCTLFVMSKHLFGITAWDFFQVKDLLSMLCLTIGLLLIYRNRPFWFATILLAGVLSGELALVMIPVLFVSLIERGEPAAGWKRWVAACIPAIAAFALVRIFVRAEGGMGLIGAGLHYGRKLGHPLTWYGLLINPFLPSVSVPAVFFRDTAYFLRKNLHMAVLFLLILVSAFFGSNNERLMAPAFIPFFAVLAYIIDRHFARSRIMIPFLLAAGLLSSMHHLIARYPLPARSCTILFSGGGAVLVTLVFFGYSITSSKERSGTG